MAAMSDQEQALVKNLLEVLAVEFGKGGEAVPEQRAFEALKNNSMDSNRAFAELEEEISRAPWDTIKTKPKQKSEKSSPNGNNNILATGRGGRGGGGRGRGTDRMDPNGRDDGFRQRPRPEGARAPPGAVRGGAERGGGRGGVRGGRPNTISRGGPLGEVQATSGPAPAEDLQKAAPPAQPVVPLEPVVQRDAPIVANQWSKGRPRTEDEMPKVVAQSVAQAVAEPSPPPPEPTKAPAVAAWSNAAQSKSILSEPNPAGGEANAEIAMRAAPASTPAVRSAPPPPAVQATMNQTQDQAAGSGSSLQQFTDMHGLGATFATMGFNDGEAATTGTQMGMDNAVSAAIQQDMGYGASEDFSSSHFSAYQQQGSAAGASAPTQQQTTQQQAPQQAEAQPVQQQQNAQQPAQQQQQPTQQQPQQPSQQPAQQQMPAPQQPAQQAAQPQQQPAAQPQAQVQQTQPAGQQQSGDDMYDKKQQMGYGMGNGYGLGADATQDSGANGSRGMHGQGQGQGYGRGGRGQQNQNQNYMAGMSPMTDQQGLPQWQQQQAANMMNWPQYWNMAAPQNFMFMQYPGYPQPQMGYNPNQNYNQQPGPQHGGMKGGYNNQQHSKKQQQGGYNQGYGNGGSFGGGFDQASNAASQDYYKNQGAAAAFQGGAGSFGYPAAVYGGMPGMDSFSQQAQQQGYGSMRGSTSAAGNSSMTGSQGMDMMAAYASGPYMGYGEQDTKAGWGH